MSRETAPNPSRPAYAEASAWLAQLHGPQRSAEMEADFRAWLAADPEHARAFEKVTDVWESIAHVNVGGLPRLSAHEPFERRSRARGPLLAAAAMAALAVCAWWMFADPSYTTGIGEQRIVNLADGTRVSLNSATRIEVDYDEDRRTILLQKGEALFEVAQDVRRPFVVVAGERSITALCTSFVVRREADRLDVTLLQGKVAVAGAEAGTSHQAGSGERVIELEPGQRLTVLADRTERLDLAQPEAATAWRRGEVILDDIPLAEAIAEMNRHDRNRLVIDDPRIARLPVSGIYRTGNNQDFALAVATMYDLQVQTEGRQIRLLPANR